ncbi:glucose-1-phosphate cytidylyltransferase [Candidatus Micrarchaeota archaeon]|nr:glucose-1-phosphate cytidylyltransferase [Candidatus Micrarchaeota archaeon]
MEDKTNVVILAGGKGLRMREYSDIIPKALVPIGPYPVILHVMHIYASYGYTNFILALGYKGEMVKEFFVDMEWKLNDFSIRTDNNNNKEIIKHLPDNWHNFNITFADTGLETQTGGRVKLIEKYVESENFFVSYCDGLTDLDISKLYEYHQKKKKIATMTAVHPMTTFGLVEIDQNNMVKSFREKPFLKDYINGGFFIFKKEFFDYLNANDILEEEPMRKLTKAGELAAYTHDGFWTCMDTFKDVDRLNSLWNTGKMIHTGYKGVVPWIKK